MGTFGTGAFSSDGAMNALDDLVAHPLEERTAVLAREFSSVREHPELVWREFFPDQVVAIVAVVAATLPGGDVFAEGLRDLYDEDLLEDIPLHAPAPGLAGDALKALLVVASQDGPWHQGWRDEAHAAEARKTTDTLRLVLDEAAR